MSTGSLIPSGVQESPGLRSMYSPPAASGTERKYGKTTMKVGSVIRSFSVRIDPTHPNLLWHCDHVGPCFGCIVPRGRLTTVLAVVLFVSPHLWCRWMGRDLSSSSGSLFWPFYLSCTKVNIRIQHAASGQCCMSH